MKAVCVTASGQFTEKKVRVRSPTAVSISKRSFKRTAVFLDSRQPSVMMCCFCCERKPRNTPEFEGRLPPPLDVPLYFSDEILFMKFEDDKPSPMTLSSFEAVWTQMVQQSQHPQQTSKRASASLWMEWSEYRQALDRENIPRKPNLSGILSNSSMIHSKRNIQEFNNCVQKANSMCVSSSGQQPQHQRSSTSTSTTCLGCNNRLVQDLNHTKQQQKSSRRHLPDR